MSVFLFVAVLVLCILFFDFFWGIIFSLLLLWAWGGFTDEVGEVKEVTITVNQQYCLDTFKTTKVRNVVSSDGTRASYCVVSGDLELIESIY